ncbi:MAG: TusE/DsrC/DsvC family sulfur relay protein [Thiobacillus sp.]
MALNVNGTTIETDEDGFLKNPEDWNEDVARALEREHEKAGNTPLDDTARGLVRFYRQYYKERLVHPTMNDVLETLKKPGESHGDTEKYKTRLYQMFPHGPVQALCRLAGLPNPGVENES